MAEALGDVIFNPATTPLTTHLGSRQGTQMAEALDDVIFIFNPATTPLPTRLGARHRDTDGRSLG